MAMVFPYSNVASIEAIVDKKRERFLLATAGARLLVTSMSKKRAVNEWNALQVPELDSRRVKKLKLEHNAPRVTNIILLSVNQHHEKFVVVTENKYLHVLALDPTGKVVELSQRRMPKRPCTVMILPEQEVILCADKHGDVYSLPLVLESGDGEQTAAETTAPAVQPTFAPSATELTVHTKRNRQALENQQKQQKFTPRKDTLDFKHEHLMGHISMLTDMAYVISSNGDSRIITADRDEHIRVSRTLPEAHIIEGYCLGHTEFISKLCPIPGSTRFISAGGDDWLGIWDWTTCELQDKVEVKQRLVNADVKLHEEKGTVTVSRIMSLQRMNTSKHAIFVLCEHVNAILTITLEGDRLLGFHVLKTEGTPLDFMRVPKGLLVSFDVRTIEKERLIEYALEEEGHAVTLKPQISEQDAVKKLNKENTKMHTEEGLDEFLYYVGTFRKRRDFGESSPGDEGGDGGDGEDGEDAEL